MKNIASVLTLNKLVFDKIEFNRKGFKNKDIKSEIDEVYQDGVLSLSPKA